LLGGHPLSEIVSSAASEHDERIDGKGYPNGLRGEQLPLATRIVSIADAFDAMTNTRPYRKGISLEQALCLLEEGAGTHFDVELVWQMCELDRAGDLAHIVGHTAEGIRGATCPHCESIIAIPRDTSDGDIIPHLHCHKCEQRFPFEPA
jgi:hypothetical protein